MRERGGRRDESGEAWDDVPAGLGWLGADGNWLRVNRRLREITGYGPGEMERISLGQMLDDPSAAPPLLETALRGGARQEIEALFRRKDGTEIWLGGALERASGDGGAVIVAALEDVSARRAEADRLRRLARDLNHRFRNSLNMVQAIATATLSQTPETSGLRKDFASRVNAIAAAHAVLTPDAALGAPLLGTVRKALETYDTARIDADGPEMRLPAKTAVNLSLCLNELAGNAARHGALSVPEGRVSLRWEPGPGGPCCRLVWQERGGPPVVPPPSRGFGLSVVAGLMAEDPDGLCEVDFAPGGLCARLVFPVAPQAGARAGDPA